MVFRYGIASLRLALFLLVGVVEASAQKAPSAKPFERLDGCVLTPDEWVDGDSFPCALAHYSGYHFGSAESNMTQRWPDWVTPFVMIW